MTPERKVWWDSLPKEEKFIRKLISHRIKELKRHKANIGFNPLGNLWRGCVKDDKMIIKALRKQIAMKPIDNCDWEYSCPVCGVIIWRVDDIYFGESPKYCENCGQKLRW